jgi:hypothetical protein
VTVKTLSSIRCGARAQRRVAVVLLRCVLAIFRIIRAGRIAGKHENYPTCSDVALSGLLI